MSGTSTKRRGHFQATSADVETNATNVSRLSDHAHAVGRSIDGQTAVMRQTEDLVGALTTAKNVVRVDRTSGANEGREEIVRHSDGSANLVLTLVLQDH